MSVISGIYAIKNKLNGKVYIGSAIDIYKRWREHRTHFEKGTNSRYLQRAWEKYGDIAFVWEIIEQVPDVKLIEREQYWIDQTPPEKSYNLSKVVGSRLGVPQPEESKQLMRDATNKNKYNRIDLVMLTYHDKTMPIFDWAKETHMRHKCLLSRYKAGWTPEEIIETPYKANQKFYTWQGKTQAQKAWAREYGISPNTLRYRLKIGMTLEEALLIPTDDYDTMTLGETTKNVIDWAKEKSVSPQVLRARRKLGWTDEEALTIPIGQERKGIEPYTYEHNGKCLTRHQWEKETGIPAGTIWCRLKRGWTIGEALETPVGNQHGRAIYL